MNDNFASKVNGFYEAFTGTITNLASRWLDERKHEDINDYKKVIQSSLNLYFTPHNMKAEITDLVEIKSTFRFKVTISDSNEKRDYLFVIDFATNDYLYKRVG